MKRLNIYIMLICSLLIMFSTKMVYADDDCPQVSGMTSSKIIFESGTDETIDNLSFCNTCADNSIDLPEPKKGIENKQFKGWYSGTNGSGVKIQKTTDVFSQSVSPFETQGCNVTIYKVYAYWGNQEITCPSTGLRKYVVNFESNGGSSIESMVHSISTDFSGISSDKLVFKIPKKEGYSFIGWYSNSNYLTKVSNIKDDFQNLDFSSVFKLNGCLDGYYTTVYAKWDKDDVVKVDDTALYQSKLIYFIAFTSLVIGACYIYLIVNNDKKNKDRF